MEFLELVKEYLPEVLLLVVDFAALVFYHKFFGKTKAARLISKQEKKVARDYEKLKADESLLEEYKKGGNQ